MSAGTYFMEKLPHLKQLKLFFAPKFNPDRYQVSIESNCVWFVRKDNKKDSIQIGFDCSVNKDQAACSIKGGTVSLTLPIIDDERKDETDDFPTADELTLSKYCLLKCRFC